MPYPANQLITEAFYTSGVASREFQTVSGDQIAAGLFLLNELLSDTQIMDGKIPYYNTNYTFNAVAGSPQNYFIPGLVKAETLTFYINSIRYQMLVNPFDKFFGSGRAENVFSLPFNWISVKTLGGSNIFLYFFPDQAYPMVLTGLFSLLNVTLFQDLLLTVDQFYINYLKYKLAERICANYSFALPAGVGDVLDEYESSIDNKSAPMDLTYSKISTLGNQTSINYAAVNLGKGWTP